MVPEKFCVRASREDCKNAKISLLTRCSGNSVAVKTLTIPCGTLTLHRGNFYLLLQNVDTCQEIFAYFAKMRSRKDELSRVIDD
jgi:hypothetical protein